MTLKKALEQAEASVAAYRALLRDSPTDYVVAAKRQLDAALLLDEARNLGFPLTGKSATEFRAAFLKAVLIIEELESQRISGAVSDEPEDDEDIVEVEDDKSAMYSSLALDEEE